LLLKLLIFFYTYNNLLQGNKAALKNLRIDLYHCSGENHAFAAENAIKITKERLYKYLRSYFSTTWPQALPLIVAGVNNTENSGLEGLTPASVNSPVSDPLTRLKRREHELKRRPLPTRTLNKVFKVNDYVYVDFKDAPFYKAFDFQKGMIFRVSDVDKSLEPWQYSVTELNGKVVKQKYYAWQLLPATDPAKTVLPIEKVLESRKRPGHGKEHLVRWLHYGPSYDSWEPEKNILKNK
jgi:hypothetical protein